MELYEHLKKREAAGNSIRVGLVGGGQAGSGYVIFPLLKVLIVSLVMIYMPLIYNQFLEPYVYLDPANFTLLPFIQSAVGQFSTNFKVIYSAIFASVLPMVLVYLRFRRFFVEGVMAGAIKG